MYSVIAALCGCLMLRCVVCACVFQIPVVVYQSIQCNGCELFLHLAQTSCYLAHDVFLLIHHAIKHMPFNAPPPGNGDGKAFAPVCLWCCGTGRCKIIFYRFSINKCLGASDKKQNKINKVFARCPRLFPKGIPMKGHSFWWRCWGFHLVQVQFFSINDLLIFARTVLSHWACLSMPNLCWENTNQSHLDCCLISHKNCAQQFRDAQHIQFVYKFQCKPFFHRNATNTACWEYVIWRSGRRKQHLNSQANGPFLRARQAQTQPLTRSYVFVLVQLGVIQQIVFLWRTPESWHQESDGSCAPGIVWNTQRLVFFWPAVDPGANQSAKNIVPPQAHRNPTQNIWQLNNLVDGWDGNNVPYQLVFILSGVQIKQRSQPGCWLLIVRLEPLAVAKPKAIGQHSDKSHGMFAGAKPNKLFGCCCFPSRQAWNTRPGKCVCHVQKQHLRKKDGSMLSLNP